MAFSLTGSSRTEAGRIDASWGLQSITSRTGGATNMEYLFKYMELKYARSLVENGTFKINTLYKFRNEDPGKASIADPHEGAMYSTYTEPGPVVESEDYGRINFTTHIGVWFNPDDRYLFCMSKCCSRNMFDRFPEYDVCIQINNIEHFYNLLTEAISNIIKIRPMGYHQCEYHSRDVDKEKLDTCDSVYLKDEKYSIEEEVRAVWLPEVRSPRLESIIIHCPEAAECCSILPGAIP
jgi:hypothetical protein